MKNNTTRTIRSEEITIDVRICATLAANRGGEVYLAAIAPDMELTIITLDEAPGILPCFEEDDACLNLPNTSLLLCFKKCETDKKVQNGTPQSMQMQGSFWSSAIRVMLWFARYFWNR